MRQLWITIFLVFSLILIGCNTGEQTDIKTPTKELNADKNITYYPVIEIIDGDTIKVNYKGTPEKVRLIGIDTPETKHPKKGVEPYGKEASKFTKNLLDGESVHLELDVQKRDKYGRLLAYVYLPNDNFVNALLLEKGYAQVMTIPPNVKYADYFLKLQKIARKENRGLWGIDELKVPTTEAKEGQFIGSIKSDKFHLPNCIWAKKINSANEIWFKNRQEAAREGYVSCQVCEP